MILQEKLTAKDVHHQTMKTLKKHLSVQADGYRCQTKMMFDGLLKANVKNSSIEAVCSDLVKVAD